LIGCLEKKKSEYKRQLLDYIGTQLKKVHEFWDSDVEMM
jgi:hypothetical protein